MEKETKIGDRKHWVDNLRAFAMIFVIYGHLLEKTECSYIYFVFTSPIKLPLFFAITGYLFRENIEFSSFAKKTIKGLVIPWLCLSIVPVFIVSILKGRDYLTSNLIAILSGVSIWYMPCCIIAEFIFYFILRCGRSKHILVLLISTIMSCIGVLLIKAKTLDILMINRALSAQLFLTIGYFIKRFEKKIDKVKSFYLWIGCVLYITFAMMSIILFPGQNLDVHKGEYYNISICLMMVILGCVLLFAIGKRFDLKSRTLGFIGRNTLVYYILASYPITIYNVLISKTGISIPNAYLSALVKSIFVCCSCAVFSVFINAFIPEIVGKTRRKVGKQK